MIISGKFVVPSGGTNPSKFSIFVDPTKSGAGKLRLIDVNIVSGSGFAQSVDLDGIGSTGITLVNGENELNLSANAGYVEVTMPPDSSLRYVYINSED